MTTIPTLPTSARPSGLSDLLNGASDTSRQRSVDAADRFAAHFERAVDAPDTADAGSRRASDQPTRDLRDTRADDRSAGERAPRADRAVTSDALRSSERPHAAASRRRSDSSADEGHDAGAGRSVPTTDSTDAVDATAATAATDAAADRSSESEQHDEPTDSVTPTGAVVGPAPAAAPVAVVMPALPIGPPAGPSGELMSASAADPTEGAAGSTTGVAASTGGSVADAAGITTPADAATVAGSQLVAEQTSASAGIGASVGPVAGEVADLPVVSDAGGTSIVPPSSASPADAGAESSDPAATVLDASISSDTQASAAAPPVGTSAADGAAVPDAAAAMARTAQARGARDSIDGVASLEPAAAPSVAATVAVAAATGADDGGAPSTGSERSTVDVANPGLQALRDTTGAVFDAAAGALDGSGAGAAGTDAARAAADAADAAALRGPGLDRISIDLSDEGLGPLTLQAANGAGGLHVRLAAGDRIVGDALANAADQLRRDLEESGTTLGSFDVGHRGDGQAARQQFSPPDPSRSGQPRAAERAVEAARRAASSVAALSPSTSGATGVDLRI